MTAFDTYWLVWTLAAAGSFIALETWAIRNKQPGTRTLSQTVWALRLVWRVLIGAFLVWLFLHWEFQWPR